MQLYYGDYKKEKMKMIKQLNKMAVIVTAVICIFSFFSRLDINGILVLSICMAFSFVIILLNSGRVYINKTYAFWIIDITLVIISIIMQNAGFQLYTLILLSMIIMSVAIISNYISVSVYSILNIIIVTGIVLIGSVIFEMIRISVFHISVDSTKYIGLARYANTVSVASVFVFFYGIFAYREKNKAYKIILFVISIIGVLLSTERSNIIVIPIVLMIVYFFFNEKNKLLIIIKILLVIAILFGIFFSLRDTLSKITVFNRIYSSIDDYLVGNSVSVGRARMNAKAISLWLNQPWTGNGWMYFFYNNRDIIDKDAYTHVHNFIFELLCDCGIIGLLLALIPIVFSIKDNILFINETNDMDRDFYKYTLSVQIFFIIDSLFHVSFYDTYIVSFYFLNVIIMYVKHRQISNQRDNRQ